MLFELRFPLRLRHRWPWWPLALALSLAPIVVLPAFGAQTASPQELSSHDVEPTFKLQTGANLVMVRVVVRDVSGAVVENLHKEDFQLFDRGKPQTILNFSLEKPVQKAAKVQPQAPAQKNADTEDLDETAVPASTASRFMAMFFDDVNTPFENLARARDAADHFLTGSVQPGDRVALYTSSGLKQVEFTDDLAQIHQALFELRPRPIGGQDTSCGAIPPYQAYLIIVRQDPSAINEATDEFLNCGSCPSSSPQMQQSCTTEAQNAVQVNAAAALSQSEQQSTAVLRGIAALVRRMTSVPGQRSVVLVSGGFLTETLLFDLDQIIERSLRGNVTINAIDARGLYTDSMYDASRDNYSASTNPALRGMKQAMLTASDREQSEALQSLAFNTGGVFFDNNNDLESGFRKVSALPAAYYLLAFAPQNLKLDGNFHPLQVKLVSHKGLAVQARRGYYAPKKPVNPGEEEAEEIREVVYSQDETHELPIDVHTQFFMKAEANARVTVLTRIDLHPLHFRKEADRNVDKLTFVTAVFDQDGHQISAQEKAVDLHMFDGTLQRYLQSGITIRTQFDVKPGTYLVRAVVRDSESGQISGLNRTVEIPY
jgi:VWFA-related protein